MISRIPILLALSLAAAAQLPAQRPADTPAPTRGDSLTLTLDDALARLSTSDPRLATARAMRDVASAARGEALSEQRNRFLPVVSASYAGQRLAQNQFVEIARRAGIPPTPVEELDPFARVFASPNNRTASINASIRPFDGGVASAKVQAARAGSEAAGFAESQTRASLEADVIVRYANVQLYRRLRDVADSAIAHAERTLAVTRQGVLQGRTAEFEIWRVEADVQALRPNRLEADRQLRLAEMALRQLLELPADTPLRLTSPVEPWSVDSARSTPANVSARPNADQPIAATASRRMEFDRLALRELDARQRQAEAQHRAAWRAMLPTLDVTLSHQRLAYPLRNDNWGGPYYQNTQIGVAFTLPLDLTGGSLARIESAAAAVRVATAQRREAERQHALDVADVESLREASHAGWHAAVAGAENADRVLRVVQARHDVGRASLLELQDARLAWQRAMAARAQAARDRVVIDARAARLHRLPITSVQP